MRHKRKRTVCVCWHHHHNAPCNTVCDLALVKGHCFAAAPAEWPGETATDLPPPAECLQHQTSTHLAPVTHLRVKTAFRGNKNRTVATLQHSEEEQLEINGY